MGMSFDSHIRVIDDPEVLRLIADPLRLRLLELLRQQPRTVKELAALLGIPRTRLYYHVRLLEEHGLVTVEETRVVSGITESRYRVTAYRLSVDKTMLGASPGDSSPLEVYLSVVLDEVAAEIRRAIASGLIDLEANHEDTFTPRRLVIGRKWYRFTDEELAEFDRRFTEFQDAFSAQAVFGPGPGIAGTESGNGELYETLIGFYPVLPPEDTSDDE
jgi:DNA-binding transcriptional ArsR family regulator